MDVIKAIIILNNDGRRYLARYFDESVNTKQFEKRVYVKTKSRKHKEDILMLDGHLVLHRSVMDLHLYVIGNRNENPLLLDRILSCLVEVVSTLINRSPESEQPFFDNLDYILIGLDEICDNGMVIETDPDLVLKRVCLRDGTGEQSIAQVLQNSKLAWLMS